MKPTDTVILIPAYKPDAALPPLCETLTSQGYSVLCVDDGSGSDFDHIFEKTASFATVLRYEQNRGKGGALKHGFHHLLTDPAFADAGCVVTADADGQHKPEDIRRVSDAVEENGGAVLGVRLFTGKVPFRSRFGNALTRWVFALCSGLKISDTQTGLRGFSRSLTAILAEEDGNRYEYEMNVLFRLAEDRIPVKEIPIATVYENNNKGSHFNPVKDSARIYKAIFARRRNRRKR